MSIPPEKEQGDSTSILKPGETMDRIAGGRLIIIQKERGYRFSLDSLLLAGFVRLKPDDYLADLGAGSGIIASLLALKAPLRGAVGVELQAGLAEMAQRSLVLNSLTDRVRIIQGDLRKIASFLKGGTFDVAVFNPPYRRRGSGRINPQEEKALARHELASSLGDFLSAAAYLLKAAGRVNIIYPAARTASLLVEMRRFNLEPKRIRIVYSRRESPGQFVLAEGIRDGKKELKIEPPLFIYEGGNAYTEMMTRFLDNMIPAEAPRPLTRETGIKPCPAPKQAPNDRPP